MAGVAFYDVDVFVWVLCFLVCILWSFVEAFQRVSGALDAEPLRYTGHSEDLLSFPKYELYGSIYRGFAGMRVSMSVHKESQKMFRSDPRTLQGSRCTGNSVLKLPRDIRQQLASPTY